VVKKVKERLDISFRINTNGQGNLIFGEDITPILKDVFDVVSISLNAKNAEEYEAMCAPRFGEDTYFGILRFAQAAKKYVPRVVLTVVDNMPEEDIEACRKIAAGIGVDFRVRQYIE
jgi:TatD family-associated radical SAM protein